jgi:hypothetical protein
VFTSYGKEKPMKPLHAAKDSDVSKLWRYGEVYVTTFDEKWLDTGIHETIKPNETIGETKKRLASAFGYRLETIHIVIID